jgi:hypothetical protein
VNEESWPWFGKKMTEHADALDMRSQGKRRSQGQLLDVFLV